MTIRGCCGGVGVPLDRIAPTWLVGNVLEGDSDTTYTKKGFTYIPDPGDGSGIDAAVAAANATPTGGRIYIRRGDYDLTGAGSPTAPFALSANVAIVGEGRDATFISGRTSGNQAIFTGGAFFELSDMTLTVPAATGAVSGTTLGVVAVSGPSTASVLLRNLSINVYALATAVLTSAVSIENAGPVRLENIDAFNNVQRLGVDETLWMTFARIAQSTANDVYATGCRVEGFDAVSTVGLVRQASFAQVTTGTAGFYRRFVHQLSADIAANVRVSGCYGASREAAAIALSLNSHKSQPAIVTGSEFRSAAGSTQPAVFVRSSGADGGYAIVQGNALHWNGATEVVRVGTSGSGNACDRNMIQGNAISNTDGGGTGVLIYNLTSVSNGVQNNSIEATTSITDGGTTTQSAGNW